MVSDLALLALGFALMTLGALLLYVRAEWILAHPDAVWAFLAGALAFVGVAHATAALLTAKSYGEFVLPPGGDAGLAVAGFLAGGGLLVLLGRTRAIGGVGSGAWVLAAATAFVAVHSLGDGYVLGSSYAGSAAPEPVTAAMVLGTLAHRLVEGALIVIPALAVAWRPPKTLGLLLVGVASVPGAFLAVAILNGPAGTVAAPFYGITIFESAVEIGIALPLLLVGMLPRLLAAGSRRWAGWATVGFVALLLVHFLVE